jgi:serine protease Do
MADSAWARWRQCVGPNWRCIRRPARILRLFINPHAVYSGKLRHQRMMTMNKYPSALRSVLAITAVVLAMAVHPAMSADVGGNKSELVRGLLPTVVNISVRKQEAARSDAATVDASTPAADTSPDIKSYVGSGFVIDSSGVIVTNYHVVENAFEIVVGFSDGSRLPAETLSASRLADLAVIRVKPEHPLLAAHWGDSDKLQVGDQVFAAGNPFGIGLSISAGIVSGLNRDIQNSPYDDLIQTDATINHGNSGGPLFDMQGNVIGVDSAIVSPTSGSSGLGFAIPSNSARFVTEQLRTYGWVRPGWIGVKLQLVTPQIAAAMGMARPEGSIVAWVLPGGPAAQAGLAIGDVILRYADTAPSDDRALLRSIAHTPVGNPVALLVQRNGQERTVTVTPAIWPRNQWDARDAPSQAQRPKLAIPPDLGLSLSASKDALKRSELEVGLNGVLITAVMPGSDAARRGITSGDVILQVQDKVVATPADVQSNIEAARASKREYVLMLVLAQARELPGPKWVTLQLGGEGG